MVHLPFQRTLSDILASADPGADKADKIRWLEELIGWVKLPINPSGSTQIKKTQHIQSARIKFLLQILERNPNWKTNTSRVIESVLIEMSPINLFVQTGLPKGTGFLGELFSRLFKKVLPFNETSQDLTDLVTKLFSSERDADWIRSLDSVILNELHKLCFTDEQKRLDFFAQFRKSMKISLVILAAQMESMMFSPDIRQLTSDRNLESSPFWLYRASVNHFIKTLSDFNSSPEEELAIYSQMIELLNACSQELNLLMRSLDENGITIQIVFKIESLESFLDRSERITKILAHHLSPESDSNWQIFLSTLIKDSLQSFYIRPFLRSNLHLISRTIVERSSQSGEHYITRNVKEYWEMARSAVGGGVLTSATTLIKIAITKANLAPFFEGFLSSLNYAGSFVLIQHLHFTLATKQPAMTAPALASRLKGTKSRSQIPEFLEEVANLVRSQFVAALGNVGAVIPAAFLIQFIWVVSTDSRIISEAYALKILNSLNPLKSLTFIYAIETGIILFVSSILAGYFENWYTYHRLGPRIENSRTLRLFLKTKTLSQLVHWIQNNLSALSGSIILGFLLGFTPIVGSFFGLPFDVRHVTLSAGSLALAASSYSLETLPIMALLGAAFGILIIGALNFTVSFSLALLVAVTSQNIKRSWFVEVIKVTAKAFRQNPKYFLFPAKPGRIKNP